MAHEEADELERALRPRRYKATDTAPPSLDRENSLEEKEEAKKVTYIFPVFTRSPSTRPRWRVGKTVRWDNSLVPHDKAMKLREKHGIAPPNGVMKPNSFRSRKKAVSMAEAWRQGVQQAAKYLEKLDANKNKEKVPLKGVMRCGSTSVEFDTDEIAELLRVESRILLKKLDGCSFLTAFYPAPVLSVNQSIENSSIKVKGSNIEEEMIIVSDNRPPLPLAAKVRGPKQTRKRN